MKYLISVDGCDDTTYCEYDLDKKELNFLINLCKEINKHSDYCCQPEIHIYTCYNSVITQFGDILYSNLSNELVEEKK